MPLPRKSIQSARVWASTSGKPATARSIAAVVAALVPSAVRTNTKRSLGRGKRASNVAWERITSPVSCALGATIAATRTESGRPAGLGTRSGLPVRGRAAGGLGRGGGAADPEAVVVGERLVDDGGATQTRDHRGAALPEAQVDG